MAVCLLGMSKALGSSPRTAKEKKKEKEEEKISNGPHALTEK